MLKRHILSVACLLALLVPAVALSTGPVEFFTATYTGTSIRLDWKLAGRQQADFDVYRKRAEEPSFRKLESVPYNGGETYTYQDDNIFRTQGEQQVAFSYKLVVRQQGQEETYIANVQNSPTAVQRSWGSIKMMFR